MNCLIPAIFLLMVLPSIVTSAPAHNYQDSSDLLHDVLAYIRELSAKEKKKEENQVVAEETGDREVEDLENYIKNNENIVKPTKPSISLNKRFTYPTSNVQPEYKKSLNNANPEDVSLLSQKIDDLLKAINKLVR